MTLEEFRLKYQELKDTSQNNKYEIIPWLDFHKATLPPFYESNLVDFADEILLDIHAGLIYKTNLYTNLIKVDPKDVLVDPSLCIGHTWLYRNDHSDQRPCSDRLFSLLSGTAECIVAIDATKAGAYYVCNDGNHRIYAAYLANRLVRIKLTEKFQHIQSLF